MVNIWTRQAFLMLTGVIITFVFGHPWALECTIRYGDAWKEKPGGFAFTAFLSLFTAVRNGKLLQSVGILCVSFPQRKKKNRASPRCRLCRWRGKTSPQLRALLQTQGLSFHHMCVNNWQPPCSQYMMFVSVIPWWCKSFIWNAPHVRCHQLDSHQI